MKNPILTAILVYLCTTVLFGQKHAVQTLTVEYSISPTSRIPDDWRKYHSQLTTPLDPLSDIEELDATAGIKDSEKRAEALAKAKIKKLEELEMEFLSLDVPSAVAVSSGAEDFTISLVTSDVKVTNVNPKPLSDLSLEETAFSYSYSAMLVIKKKSGEILMEEALSKESEAQNITKAMIFDNPIFKAKMNLYKDNPEKLKKFSDKALDKKSHLVLIDLLDRADKLIADRYETQIKTTDIGIFSVKGKAYAEVNQASDNVFAAYAKFRSFSKKNRITKEEMDKVIEGSLVVWDQYRESKKEELEEKAYKGLALNSLFATTWIGQFDKAKSYLGLVPETIENNQDEEEEDDRPPGSAGATIILSFPAYAAHAKHFCDALMQYGTRLTIIQ